MTWIAALVRSCWLHCWSVVNSSTGRCWPHTCGQSRSHGRGSGGSPREGDERCEVLCKPVLNRTGLDGPGRKRWARHGSTRWLWKPEHVSAAIAMSSTSKAGEWLRLRLRPDRSLWSRLRCVPVRLLPKGAPATRKAGEWRPRRKRRQCAIPGCALSKTDAASRVSAFQGLYHGEFAAARGWRFICMSSAELSAESCVTIRVGPAAARRTRLPEMPRHSTGETKCHVAIETSSSSLF